MFGKSNMIHLVAESGPDKGSLQEVLDFAKTIAKQVDARVSPDNIVKFQFEPLEGSELSEKEIAEMILLKCDSYSESPVMDVSVS